MHKLVLYLQKTIATYRREGIKSTVRKFYLRIRGYYVKAFSKRPKTDSWRTLKGKFKGETVFLIGNGPSLNETPLYLLKDQYSMVFNRFPLMSERLNWIPSFYSVTDDLVLEDLIHEIEEMTKGVQYSFFPDIHFRGQVFFKRLGFLKNVQWLHQKSGLGFSDDLPEVYPGGSVIYDGLQVLKYLGFSRVIMVGVDMNFKLHNTAQKISSGGGVDIISKFDDDPNHFDPRYFGKGRKYHQPENYVIQNILRFLQYTADNVISEEFQIINAGYGSKVEYFPKRDFLRFLDKKPEEIKRIFEELLISKCGKSLDQFETEYPFVKSAEAIDSMNSKASFYTYKELGVDQVKRRILDYIPLGPFDNKYYFIIRSNA